MTILSQPTKQRRDAIGEHACIVCGTRIRIDAADLLSIPLTGTPLRDSSGDLWWRCPNCQAFIKLNGWMP